MPVWPASIPILKTPTKDDKKDIRLNDITRAMLIASPLILKTPTKDKQQDFEQNDSTREPPPAALPKSSLSSMKPPMKDDQKSLNFSNIQHQTNQLNKELEKTTQSNLEFKNYYQETRT